MSKHVLALLLCLSSAVGVAGPYVELGVGATVGTNDYNCISDYTEAEHKMGCSDNPLGVAAVGYRYGLNYGDIIVHLEHASSLKEKDRGLNTISIRYRYEFKDW